MVGETLFFVAEHPKNGRVLFQSDGTPAGTSVCRITQADGPVWPPIQAVEMAATTNSRIILAAPHPTRGKLDELILQVVSIQDDESRLNLLNLSSRVNKTNPHQLTASGALVYFVFDDGVHGEELWVTDGTQQGTRLVKCICSP